MAKLTIDELALSGKNVLMRVDFNVPLDENKVITDDLRVQAALPSIRKVINDGGRAILCSHLGRPNGERKPDFSLKPVADHLAKLLDQPVQFANDCIGGDVDTMKQQLNDGDVLLLENLRFHPGETANDPDYAKQLAAYCDAYVNDAFGTAHRAHASTEGVTHLIDQCAAGYLMQKELKYLGEALSNPKRPFVAILGGAKISGKIDVIQNLLGNTDALLVGGGMIFTFYKAHGWNIGNSILEEERLEMAKDIMKETQGSSTKFELPTDVLIADKFDGDATTQTVGVHEIPDGWLGVDIGEKTIAKFKEILSTAKTVVWNGPMGVFEIPAFAKGTEFIARYLVEITANGATTIVGGGDSAAAVKKFNLDGKLSHVSTGGGASLEFLEGKTLPGVAALSDN